MARVLMVDDDTRLTAMLADYLAANGLKLEARATASDGLAALRREAFDALISTSMLPDADGFEVCRQIRAQSDIPILMLTARGEETDRVIGLELGADDYLAKPFGTRELLARVRALCGGGAASGRRPRRRCASASSTSTAAPAWPGRRGAGGGADQLPVRPAGRAGQHPAAC